MTTTSPQPQFPSNPASDVMWGPSRFHAILRAGAAAVLLVIVVVMASFTSGFPSAAPVEQAYSFLIMVSLFGGMIALASLAVVAGVRRSRQRRPGAIGGLVIVSVPLTVLPLLIWLAFAFYPTATALAAGDRARYMTETGTLALCAGAIVLGIVFALVGLRAGSTRTRVVATVSLACAAVLLAAMIVPTVWYGLGLTD